MRHRLWPDTLPGQLLVIFAGGIALLVAMNFWLIYKLQDSYISQTLTDRVNIAASRMSLMNSWDGQKRQEALADLSRYNDDSWSVGHVFLDKAPASAVTETPREKEINDALRTRLAIKGNDSLADTRVHIFSEKPKDFPEKYQASVLEKIDARRFPLMEMAMQLKDGSWFVIFQSMKFDFTDLAHIQRIQIAVYTIGFCFLFYIVLRLVLSPLQKLSSSADAFGKNPEASDPLEETGSRELRQAAHAMNGMRQRICDNLEQRNQMLAALAHDLRTPLARIQLRAEGIEDSSLSEAFLKDCKEIETLANHGLELARSLHSDEKPVRLDLGSFIESIVEDYHDTGHEVTYSRSGNDDLYLLTRPACLRRCMGNLLDNAFRYAGNAQIILNADSGNISVEIIDTGPGIPANELKNVFKPFYQLDKSRNKKFGGMGLGLSIAYNMAMLSFARLSLHPNTPTGLAARLLFPKN